MGNAPRHPPSLPQDDPDMVGRLANIGRAQEKYELEQKTFALKDIHQREVNVVNIPPMIREVPFAEWRSISSFGCEVWSSQAVNCPDQAPEQQAQADHWFAWQMLNGVTQNLIRRVEEIPEEFLPFVDIIEDDHPYLNDALDVHAENEELFVVDLADVSFNEPTLLSPIALFVINNNLLMPVAIRIDQNDANEISRPPPVVGGFIAMQQWVKARMWFNMLGAQYHESITHLGFTHMLMDGVSVCLHRNLSERHPIYKLMLPHFRYMHSINELAISKLLGRGAFVDTDMYFGRTHMLKLIARRNANWNFLDQILNNDLNNRGVMDLPGYHFRHDALLLQGAIQNYVQEYVSHYYDNNDENVAQDVEIQNFRIQLEADRTMDGNTGCGMQGVPEFDSIANLVTVLTNFIYICSVEHSATNFPQYDQYGFPPNMPATLLGQPELQNGANALDIAMPTGHQVFSTVKIMKVLTTVLTNSLGNYESVYLNAMDNIGRGFVENFRMALAEIETTINQRNAGILQNQDGPLQDYPYEWLLPSKVLNSISI
ncbi:arachidonate 12-lipoxygenase, 12R-type-like isoform X2 [Ostrea edulis]|uniref:arachidonate 12-lipoxygenase, 12R-type-like isoform X2 n=1 Tax=Ostrea edulis TaxID=37623 RepID=UPI0024AF01A8|nr:arachidonate 12-lipoxygenase, 12R-type-like isoform X2 [Ostrea edulis]